MYFRYVIGVLRAIAVIAVVLFHFKAPFFQGGFVGVDIFFVISGFLMTSIILKGFQQQNFNFWAFYSKRAQRIVPALAVKGPEVKILDRKSTRLNSSHV